MDATQTQFAWKHAGSKGCIQYSSLVTVHKGESTRAVKEVQGLNENMVMSYLHYEIELPFNCIISSSHNKIYFFTVLSLQTV